MHDRGLTPPCCQCTGPKFLLFLPLTCFTALLRDLPAVYSYTLNGFPLIQRFSLLHCRISSKVIYVTRHKAEDTCTLFRQTRLGDGTVSAGVPFRTSLYIL